MAKVKNLFHGSGSGTININHNESHHEYDKTLKITNNDRTQIKVVNNQSTNIPHAVRNNIYSRQLQGAGIAFSVYLDHDLDLGAPEVLKYNKIITNEGGGYNLNTGAFICPESGMYLLSFYIGERGGLSPQGAYIYLKVNNVNIIDAVVDAPHYTQDLQGGNSVIIRLKAGYVVITQHEDSGGHVEGAAGLRLTSLHTGSSGWKYSYHSSENWRCSYHSTRGQWWPCGRSGRSTSHLITHRIFRVEIQLSFV
ncbi:uncharacterized protein LOC134704842 [Mytilus trossulus]|uniref:uncharacterized protein LOC134704842 n=1 Tax=Mytilus trossulus TaxID=6551 RepID=UPI0030048C9C